ncbi:MAG TPA: serine protease, partial [Chthoniobacteraceae bacterium]|nr:serine protease [Chthoniobacteraceae bacterium]
MASRRFPQRPGGQTSRGLLLAIAAMLLASAGWLRAGDRADVPAATVLTSYTWKITDGGQLLLRVFKADGTFSSTPASSVTGRSGHSVDHMTGHWRMANDRVVITYDKDSAVQNVLLPLRARSFKVIDENGKQRWMTKTGALAMALPPAPGSPPAASVPSSIVTPPENVDSSPRMPGGLSESEMAAQIVRNSTKSLVFVDGNEGSGSGFIAKVGNGTFLVTNLHVVSEIHNAVFKALDGTVVKGGAASAAVGEDICCMAMPNTPSTFQVMQDVEKNVTIGDSVVVLGNAEGSGVVDSRMGKIVGIGPNLVEVDAPFIPGNSGSPIIHLKSGKVIGVATYMTIDQYDPATKRWLRKPVVRRFGYRLDSVKQWQPIYWSAFYAQAGTIEAIEKVTLAFINFFEEAEKAHGQLERIAYADPVIRNRLS